MASKIEEMKRRLTFYRNNERSESSTQELKGRQSSNAKRQRQMAHEEMFGERTVSPRYKNSQEKMATVKVDINKSLADYDLEEFDHHVSAEETITQATSIATGVTSLDLVIGGALPAGAVEIYGEESTGKTTLLAQIIREAQIRESKVMLCLSEYFDAPYMERIGVNLDDLLLLKTDKLVHALKIGTDFIESNDRCVLAIDSATGLRSADDKFASEWNLMLLEWLERTVDRMSSNSCVILTNQVRAKKSLSPRKMFAGGTDSTARRIAGVFDTRFELSRNQVSEKNYEMSINVVANRLSMPMSFVDVPVKKGYGIDIWKDLVRAAMMVGIIEQRGSWFFYNGDTRALGIGPEGQLGHGIDETANNLKVLRGSVVREEVLRVVRG